MCGSSAPERPLPPAPPPAPPPVLEQAAPEAASPSEGDQVRSQALGTRRYRSNLSINPGTTGTSGNTGLGISM